MTTNAIEDNRPGHTTEEKNLIEFINLKLAARGFPIFGNEEDYPVLRLSGAVLRNVAEKNRLLSDYLCPADQRVQDFLEAYLSDVANKPDFRLPSQAITLERPGLARVLSIPPDRDYYKNSILESYRVQQGVLHNPKSDRRTTAGVFHVTDGGLPVPADKKTTPKAVFAQLLDRALKPPKEIMRLPFSATQDEPVETFVSLLLRPTVVPEVVGFTNRKRLEVRFFAPGSLVANLDFVESIFGNGGDPYLPENDSQLDSDSWTGHTGCVILAPHLVTCTKKELGLPHVSDATDLQKRDGMCWENEDEIYNDGQAFKVTCRDKRGVVVTLIADNYFGYCKKEVKTQISYSANLYGLVEEEHAGGAVAFPSYDLGEDFHLSRYQKEVDHTFADVLKNYADDLEIQPEGHALDKNYPNIIYVPEDVTIDLREQEISWRQEGKTVTLRLQADCTYLLPSGYKVELVKPGKGRRWRLIGTTAEGTFCHKPCTVSGGGKSEISKSIANAIIGGPVFVEDFKKDFDLVEEIVNRDFSHRFKKPSRNSSEGRPLLSLERSLGSVVKLMTPNPDYTDEYNTWLKTVPEHIKELVLILKRVYQPEWGEDWRKYYSVDTINGSMGRELKYKGSELVTHYLRIGFSEDGAWRRFSLRKDFHPASKLQMEDDISASVVVPRDKTSGLPEGLTNPSVKILENCERMFFQRPDEAIFRGYDEDAELDFSKPNSFFSNYQPLSREKAQAIVNNVVLFDQFTEPMKRVIREFAEASRPDYLVSTSNPRIVDGKITKNPRYLEMREDLEDPRSAYLADRGVRLYRRIPKDKPAPIAVNAVLPGRRNNPADPANQIRSLAVFNPIHFQALPELFMEFISSLTGKSPSTTGAGSEGAMTKGPFNALPPIIDLNAALVSYLLTGYESFTTSAGCIGPKWRVDHDISLLIPEVWSRMRPEERTSEYLIEGHFMDACADLDVADEIKPYVSRLGYRINEKFVRTFFGRVFTTPDSVVTEDMLKPELQDKDCFVEGMLNIGRTQKRVADFYFEDQSVNMACPPLKALLEIMAFGDSNGLTLESPQLRSMFTRDSLLESEWYKARLDGKQRVDIRFWKRQIEYLENFQTKPSHRFEAERMKIGDKIAEARDRLAEVEKSDYPTQLSGTIGVDPNVVP